MRPRVAGVAAATAAATIQLVNYGISQVVDTLGTRGAADWLPQFGSSGWTATVYFYASDAITFVLAVPLVALLGYWVGQSLDVSETYPRIAGSFAVGGGVGFLVGLLLTGVAIRFWEALLIVGGKAAATGIQFAFVGLAGAALAEFGVGRRSPQPGETSNVDGAMHSDEQPPESSTSN